MEKGLPKNWINTTLYTCLLPVKTGISKYNETKKYYSTGSIKDDNIEPEGEYTYEEKPSRANREVELYDILQARMAETDKAFLITEEYKNSIFSTGFIQLRAYADTISPKLVYYYLKSKQFNEQKNILSTGATQVSISDRNAKEILFPLPPLPEQTRIVAKLDQLFGQLGQIKESLDKIPQFLKDFRQQVLTQAVTGKLTEEWREGKELPNWQEETLGSILLETPKNGAYYPKSLYGRGTRIIRIDSFYDGVLKNWEKVQKVEISDKDYEAYKLEEGNIVINRVNSIDYLGKCMLVEDLPEPAIFESNMMRLNLDRNIVLPKYLRTYLISQIGIKQLRQNAKHAVNQASINQTDVKMVIINLPKLEEQQEIVTRIETLFNKADLIEQQYQSLKQKIDTLPQAILHKAFKGELVPQLESDGEARDLLEEIKELKTQAAKPNTKKPKAYRVDDVELGRVAEDEPKYSN